MEGFDDFVNDLDDFLWEEVLDVCGIFEVDLYIVVWIYCEL